MNASQPAIPFPNAYPSNEAFLPKEIRIQKAYTIRFAQNPTDLDLILRLRYEVFNLEMDEGLASSEETGRDEDAYDSHCHHLMIIENKSQKVIGTYRMQTYEVAMQGLGFYTNSIFDLSALPQEMRENSLEVGRACIAKNHRNGRVLFLLWAGLVWYLEHNKKTFYFGCCSLTSQDPEEGVATFDYLEANHQLRTDVRVKAQPGYECEIPEEFILTQPKVKIPRLMKIYIDYGIRMASEPAIDRDFKTIDFLALAHVNDVSPRIMKMLRKTSES